jgi:hypothetical protein
LFPKQGDQEPWINTQDFRRDRALFTQPLAKDTALKFSTPLPPVAKSA